MAMYLTGLRLERDAFVQACIVLLERIRGPIERAVLDAGMSRDDFDEVILVGGATRMPVVRSHVGRLFGRIPATTIDPDLVVAMGAAVQAALTVTDGLAKPMLDDLDAAFVVLGEATIDTTIHLLIRPISPARPPAAR